MEIERVKTLLHNVLVEVVTKTGISEAPELYIPWLKEEIGMTDKISYSPYEIITLGVEI